MHYLDVPSVCIIPTCYLYVRNASLKSASEPGPGGGDRLLGAAPLGAGGGALLLGPLSGEGTGSPVTPRSSFKERDMGSL